MKKKSSGASVCSGLRVKLAMDCAVGTATGSISCIPVYGELKSYKDSCADRTYSLVASLSKCSRQPIH